MLFERVESFLDRQPWLLPAIGFVGGWASFILVQRGDQLAKVVAVTVLAGWIWFFLQPLIVGIVRKFGSEKFSTLLSNFVTQSIQQEVLFFSLPFLMLSTNLNDPGQIMFTGLIIVAAIISTIDPVYENYIADNRLASLAFHSLCSFVSALVILPIVIKIPVEKSFLVAFLFVIVWLIVATPVVIMQQHSIMKKTAAACLMLIIPMTILAFRGFIPPAAIEISTSLITTSVIDHEPAEQVVRISKNELAKGLYAYAVISAPKGLSQGIIFHWVHGTYSEDITSEITGGREEGYRTYSYKENFIDDAVGLWEVEILTPQRQLLRKLKFEVGS